VKPFLPAELVAQIRRYLKKKQRNPDAARAALDAPVSGFSRRRKTEDQKPATRNKPVTLANRITLVRLFSCRIRGLIVSYTREQPWIRYAALGCMRWRRRPTHWMVSSRARTTKDQARRLAGSARRQLMITLVSCSWP